MFMHQKMRSTSNTSMFQAPSTLVHEWLGHETVAPPPPPQPSAYAPPPPSAYAQFAQRFAQRHADTCTALGALVLREFARAHQVLDRFVQAHDARRCCALDDTLAYDLFLLLDTYRSAYASERNAALLLRRFVHDRLAEYECALRQRTQLQAIHAQQLWRRTCAPPVSERLMPDASSNAAERDEKHFEPTRADTDAWHAHLRRVGVLPAESSGARV